MKRRDFLHQMGYTAAGLALAPAALDLEALRKPWFEISLAEWSLHKTLFANKMTNLDFPVRARKDFGIGVVEYVNSFFKDKAKDTTYLNELLMRCKDNNVKNHLIMIDGEGDLGSTDDAMRMKAVDNHKPWIECAKYLGCTTIRVNAAGRGTAAEVGKAAIDGLSRVGEYGASMGINVVVENHGSYSSNGKWLADVMKEVGKSNVGTLPDFGNFCMRYKPNYAGCEESYDRYLGVEQLMPYAKAVSAKSHAFDAKGNESEIDYPRIMEIVKKKGFRGYVGIEYEGNVLSEDEGIMATKRLLEKIQRTM